VTNTKLAVGAGLVLGIMFTASPLTVVTVALMVPLVACAGRGLPPSERRLLIALLVAAIALRAAAIGGLVAIGIPQHNQLAIGSMTGDDAYYLARAIRARDVLMGYAGGKYDHFVVNDEYGRTSYLSLLTALQVMFGPTPFSVRLLNALFFVAGAVLLFRVARQAFGSLPAFIGLFVMLFLPSLVWSSITILKESLYFLCSAALLFLVVSLTRRPHFSSALALMATSALLLWLLDDLRRGALALAVSGLALAIIIRVTAATRTRLALAAAAALVVVAVALSQPRLQDRAIDAVETAARVHGGHVFTVGHAYKLLDEGFYKNPAAPGDWPLELTGVQAARFVVRAAIAFVTIPWPWQMRSLGELAYLPDQVIWYLMLVGLPAGILAGWKRDRWSVSLLIGLAAPVAIAVALTNGNVGTLMRLRGLVTPYLIWIGALGLLVMANALAAARQDATPHILDRTVEA
jgi:4-amino-4-deoxy-L-arabinose transferase-like glycosyltransferase